MREMPSKIEITVKEWRKNKNESSDFDDQKDYSKEPGLCTSRIIALHSFDAEDGDSIFNRADGDIEHREDCGQENIFQKGRKQNPSRYAEKNKNN